MRRAAARAATVAAIVAGLATGACAGSGKPAAPAGSTSAAASVSAAAATAYARTATRTALGDPATLDVCAVAATADLSGITGTRLVAPAQAELASCELTASPTGSSSKSGRIDVQVRGAAPTAGGVYSAAPARTTLLGLPLARHPFVVAQASCPRVLSVPRTGAPTAYVRIVNTGGAGRAVSATTCAINERIARRFIAVARGATAPRVAPTTRSLVAIDACRAAAAARVGRIVGATGTAASRRGTSGVYGSSCTITGTAGRLELFTGTLRTASARVAGSARTVDGRRFYLQSDAAPQCAVTAPLDRQTVTALFTSSTDSIPADCGPAARVLTAYLDVITRR